MCDAAGVVLAFLPPYSPDFNPIEESFSELKAWVKRNNELVATFDDFGGFLHLAVQQVGENNEHAKQHFKNAGIGL
jgi:transposase